MIWVLKWVKGSQLNQIWVDGTFFDETELPHRNIQSIPHPSIQETMNHFDGLSPQEKAKIHLLHLNHSNPLCDPKSPQTQLVFQAGYNIAQENDIFILG